MISNWFTVPRAADLGLRGVVYLLRNMENGKVYVGQTGQQLLRRLYCYAKSAPNPHLAAAISKYGLSAFEVSVLGSSLDRAERIALERKTIASLGSMSPAAGYNKTEGGEATQFSPETRAAISLRLAGNQHAKGKKLSIKTRGLMSLAHKGKPHSAATRAALSAALRGRPKPAHVTEAARAGLIRWHAWRRYRDQEAKSQCADGAHVQHLYPENGCPKKNETAETFEAWSLICLNTLQRGSWQFNSVWDPEKYDAMCVYGQLKDGRWRISLYSTKPEVDCGAICKAFGGGGHVGAAGFVCDELPWRNA